MNMIIKILNTFADEIRKFKLDQMMMIGDELQLYIIHHFALGAECMKALLMFNLFVLQAQGT